MKVHACCERQVEDLLSNYLWMGGERLPVEVFLPVQKAYKCPETGKIIRGKLAVEGIVFVSIVPKIANINAIRHLSKVLDFYNLPNTNTPEAIPDEQITQFQQILNESLSPVKLVDKYHKGDKVRVVGGSLEGMYGILESDDQGHDYLYVEFQTLKQYIKVRINKADVVLCDTIPENDQQQTLSKLLSNARLKQNLDTFSDLYGKLTAPYLKNLPDADLCALVSFYQVLLQSQNTLTLLRSTVWKQNKYRYQDFFAKVYVELAQRVKADRNKEYRAPLLHALNSLCYQVSEHAYTIKTNTKWVAESISSIATWFMTYEAKGANYHYVRLLTNLPQEEWSKALELKTWTRSKTSDAETVVRKSPLDILNKYSQQWYDEFVNNPTALAPYDIAQRIQLLATVALNAKSKLVTVKKLKPLLPQLTGIVVEGGTAYDAICLAEALHLLYSDKVSETQEFATLQNAAYYPLNYLSAYCLRAIVTLHNIERQLAKSPLWKK